MRRRVRAPATRPLTPDEIARTRLLIDALWPGRIMAQQYVEWDRYLIIDWLPGGSPVSQVRLPIAYLDDRTATRVRAPMSDDLPSLSYRQDRSGEPWHIIPPNEHGIHGRALCGEPRQGTRLSESLAEWAPTPPQRLCPSCHEQTGAATRKDAPDVQLSPA